ncbi:MAG: 6-bladed beta-propeller [Balneolaceae bacterium]|nr:MAG: 6-bladed beta-propeller [Balneolaceae bacterium]
MSNYLRFIPAGLLLWTMATGCTGNDAIPEAPDHILALENVTIYSSADVENADTLKLVREQIFSDTDENPITTFGAVIADSLGRVYIGDRNQRTVHLFEQDGEYQGRIGREGDGPGEFRWVGAMDIHDNGLYVYDPNGGKINLFEVGTGVGNLPEYETSIVIGGDSWNDFPEEGFMNPGFHSVRSDGSLFLTSRTSPFLYRENPDSLGVSRYYRWTGDSSEQPEVFFEISEPKYIVTDMFFIPPQFATRGLATISSDDQIYSANTGEFLIHLHDAEGNRLSSFYYPFEKHELTRSEAVNSVDDIDQLRDAVQSMELPGTWPALRQMIADNSGRVWISVYTGSENATEWWVLEESGQLLARFKLPDGMSIARVNKSHLYTRETDEETGLQKVVRYRIEIGDEEA